MCSDPYFSIPKEKMETVGDYKENVQLFKCGKCEECLIAAGKVWSHRMELEYEFYKKVGAFVTLTFNEENLPENGNLVKEELVKYLKRLRFNLGREIKYFAVGEYGAKKLRPHYHLVLFNVDGKDVKGNNYRQKKGLEVIESQDDWQAVYDSWQGKGIVECERPMSSGAFNYLGGYVLKLSSRRKDIEKLGLEPEFRLMSKGLGRRRIEQIADKWKKKSRLIEWPVRYLQRGKWKKPLGRFLSQVLHECVGKAKILKEANKTWIVEQFYTYATVMGVMYMKDVYLFDTENERKSMVQQYKMKRGLL